jgi:hypothetical protein
LAPPVLLLLPEVVYVQIHISTNVNNNIDMTGLLEFLKAEFTQLFLDLW